MLCLSQNAKPIRMGVKLFLCLLKKQEGKNLDAEFAAF